MSDAGVREVSALIDAFGDTLHARDLDASMAVLDVHPELTVIPSEGVYVYRGPEAVRAFLARIYGGPRRYGWRLGDRTISLDGSAAWFTAAGLETIDEGGPTRTIPYCLTGVAVSTSAGWRLRLLHASEDSTRTSPLEG
jgi:ketosteroid isomerase-like protein